MPVLALQRRLEALAGDAPGWTSFLPAPRRQEEEREEVHSPREKAACLPKLLGRAGKDLVKYPEGVPEVCTTASPAESVATSDSGMPAGVENSSLLGSVWKLSREAAGCRRVQAALDACGDDLPRQRRLTAELRGHVWEAIRCPHANHVVQKCIKVLHQDVSQFILEEVLQHGPGVVPHVARHRFGCRVLERLIESFSDDKVRHIVEQLLSEAVALATHPYGNYVIQHALKHGSRLQRARLCEKLGGSLNVLGPHVYGSAVLVRALATTAQEPELRAALTRQAATTPGLLEAMANGRHGHIASRLLLQGATTRVPVATREVPNQGAKSEGMKMTQIALTAMEKASRHVPRAVASTRLH